MQLRQQDSEKRELTSAGFRDLSTIVGKAGKGKTTLLRAMLRQSRRALVYDPLAVMSPGLVCHYRDEVETFLDSDREEFRIIYRPHDKVTGSLVPEYEIKLLQSEMDWLAGVARETRYLDLFVDEIDSIGEWSEEKMSRAVPKFWALVNFGRRRDVSIHGTVRRPQVKIPRDWVTETTFWMVFQTTDEYDIRAIQAKFPATIEQIKTLKRFQYLEYNCETSQMRRLSIISD